MLTQDPWDSTIDQYCALNAQVARVACDEKIGADRYGSLKITKTYNALRVLFLTENKLYMHLKLVNNHKKTARKG